MSENLRNEANYPLLVFLFRDHKGKFHDALEMPTLFRFNTTEFTLEFEGWENIDDWRNRKSFVFGFNYRFIKPIAEIKSAYKAVFDLLEVKIFDVLGLDSENYFIEDFSLNLHNLTINVIAKREIEHGTQTTYYQITNAEDFEAVKLANPELVQTLVGFAIEYGKTNSEEIHRMDLLG